MYDAYFGFSESPFANKSDQRLLFLSKDHEDILAALSSFIIEQQGFALVCGEVGIGKTMLVNGLLNRLPESVQPIFIANPLGESRVIMLDIAKALQVTVIQDNFLELNEVENALLEGNRHQKHFVLIIDDAHLLSDRSLEELWLLSNIERHGQKLIQILLVGGNDLNHKLDRPEMQRLRQSINLIRFLSPLNPWETIQYIDHRLQKTGSSFAACFAPDCQDLIFTKTAGVPGRINQVCDQALMACMNKNLKKVDREILENANQTGRTPFLFTRSTYGLGKPWFPVLASVIILLVVSLVGFPGFWGNKFQQFVMRLLPSATSSEDTKIYSPPVNLRGEGDPPALERKSRQSGSKLPSGPGKPGASATAAARSEPSRSLATRGLKPRANPGVAQKTSPKQGKADAGGATTQVAAPGENLTRIVAKHYPGHTKMGIDAVILANPDISNGNLIHPGQAVNLPKINYPGKSIQLSDNLFYSPYGHYYSPVTLQKDLSWLTRKKVRYLVRKTKESDGRHLHRVFLGGYAKEEDLQQAQRRVRTKSK